MSLAVVGYDPLRDKTYQSTRLGRDVADFLAWKELGGASPRTLDQNERDLARGALLFPDKGMADITDEGLTSDLYGHLDTRDVLADLAVIEGRL